MNTSEVKSNIEEVLTFDDEDLIQSETRNEIKIIQRIGNIVSHQNEQIKVYPEGFIVDKSVSPTMFYPAVGTSSAVKPMNITERKKRKTRAESRKNIRKARKRDWLAEQESHSELGALGEEFVFEREKDEVVSFDPGAVCRVIHLSREQGDGLGYDVLSLNVAGETLYIEVKTTEGDVDTPFFMSSNEKDFFEENINNPNVFIYRVYEFNKASRHGKIKKISAATLFADYEFDPMTYRVRKK